ncbi:uncharacterized protein CC84DRAFT_1221420 [Paraphaeosphaeria sporulosa]|uniref:Uncharacterized protein n=1 Tax=Paraphaeosphaeria sporulosa TaxID=1460663 RepID=A0A177C2A2_9PLEO|nr:uncharacterized protein CC84DRAFT_1221420 [Paraphaeosphaeria sporulosa]OAG00857.1 hypothetical protein CC84DRAFT_1221420 [Paraphaeosphaeria sporulosa]
MFSSISSFVKELLPQIPEAPRVTITAARIAADGTPPHLVRLSTRSAGDDATDSFLFRIPDVRKYWVTEDGSQFRDIHRLELQELHTFLQPYNLLPLFHPWQGIHLRQRCRVPTQRILLQERHASCAGVYYLFWSFAMDDLPRNKHVPKWISDAPNTEMTHSYYGDVFIVKIAPHEYEPEGWAAYEDVSPTFVEALVKSPSYGEEDCSFCGKSKLLRFMERKKLPIEEE